MIIKDLKNRFLNNIHSNNIEYTIDFQTVKPNTHSGYIRNCVY